jgi:hypothetical protein
MPLSPKARKKTAFVPRVIFHAAAVAGVVPLCAVGSLGCGGETVGSTSDAGPDVLLEGVACRCFDGAITPDVATSAFDGGVGVSAFEGGGFVAAIGFDAGDVGIPFVASVGFDGGLPSVASMAFDGGSHYGPDVAAIGFDGGSRPSYDVADAAFSHIEEAGTVHIEAGTFGDGSLDAK